MQCACSALLQDLRYGSYGGTAPALLSSQREEAMKLHLISSAVVLYTLLTLAMICLSEVGTALQNVPF
jgi:hypothetical protein